MKGPWEPRRNIDRAGPRGGPAGHTATGEEAIALAERLRPDVVLMDIILAGAMEGIEAAREIRSRCSIPVVFLTVRDDEATMETARGARPFGYVIKPVQDRGLRSVVETAIHLHSVERALREANARLELAQTAARSGAWEWDVVTGHLAQRRGPGVRVHPRPRAPAPLAYRRTITSSCRNRTLGRNAYLSSAAR